MIGVFDSGLGGLTVVKELRKALPGKGVVYFGDTARMPYGTKGPAAVAKFAAEDARFLVSRGAKAIIIACNTASALGYEEARRAVKVPVFEVITPAATRATQITGGRVGVIGTRGTMASGVYEKRLRAITPRLRITTQACPLFVPLVEEGWAARSESASIARSYLRPLRTKKIDTLILGCTHYPFLRSAIRRAIGPEVRIVDPAREAVAAFVRHLETHPELAASLGHARDSRYYVSDKTAHFSTLAERWLGSKIKLEQITLEPTC